MKKVFLLLGIVSLSIWACEKDDDDNTTSTNTTTNTSTATPDQIADALELPTGAEKITGSLPTASDAQNAPSFSLSDSNYTIQNGSVTLQGDFGTNSRKAGGLNIQVEGSSYYYKVPIKANSATPDSSSGTFELNIGLRSGVTNGDVKLNLNFYDQQKDEFVSLLISILLKQLNNQGNDYYLIVQGRDEIGEQFIADCDAGEYVINGFKGNSANRVWAVALEFEEDLGCNKNSGTYQVYNDDFLIPRTVWVNVFSEDTLTNETYLDFESTDSTGGGTVTATSVGGKVVYQGDNIRLRDFDGGSSTITVSFKITE